MTKRKLKKGERWALIDAYVNTTDSTSSGYIGGWDDLSPSHTTRTTITPPMWPSEARSINKDTPIIVDGKITTMGEIIRTLRLMERILKHELAAEIIAEALQEEDEDDEEEFEES